MITKHTLTPRIRIGLLALLLGALGAACAFLPIYSYARTVAAPSVLAVTEIEDLEVQEITIAPIQEWTGGAGGNLATEEIDDWAPTGIQTKSFIVTRGADNEGSRITGIDSTNIEDGAIRFLVNLPTGATPPTDSGTLTFVHESSGSLAANRIQTPGAQDCTFPMYSVIGLAYGGMDGTDPTPVKRWRVMSNCGWTAGSGSTKTQRLQFYPVCTVGTAGSPISGTLNDWRPTCQTQLAAGYNVAGALTDSYDHTAIRVYTDAGGATVSGLYTSASLANARGLGLVKFIQNLGPGTLTLQHLGGGSDVNARFYMPQGRDLVLRQYESAMFYSPLNNAIDLTAQWYTVATGQSNEIFPSILTTGTTNLDGMVNLGGITTPSALASGSTNDYNPGSRLPVWRLTPDAAGSTLTGILAPTLGDDEIHLVQNISTSGNLTLTHLGAGSSAANRFFLPRALSLVLPPGGGAVIRYDATLTNWVVLSHTRPPNDVVYSSAVANNIPRFADTNGTLTTAALTDDGSTLTIGSGRTTNVAGIVVFQSSITATTALAAIQAPAFSNRLVPTALTSGSSTHNWAPTNLATFEHVAVTTSSSTTATLTGITSGNNGALKTLCNYGPGPLKITNEDSNSTAANRITLQQAIDTTLLDGVTGKVPCILFRYDSSDSRWTELARNYDGTNVAAPAASTCGTGPTFSTNSHNEAFTITTGTGATACTITFGDGGYTNAPTCVVSAQSGTQPAYTVSTTALTMSTAAASAVYDVLCRGH